MLECVNLLLPQMKQNQIVTECASILYTHPDDSPMKNYTYLVNKDTMPGMKGSK